MNCKSEPLKYTVRAIPIKNKAASPWGDSERNVRERLHSPATAELAGASNREVAQSSTKFLAPKRS